MMAKTAARANNAHAMAEPYPKSSWENDWLYWYSTIVMPASLTPPTVPLPLAAPKRICGSVKRPGRRWSR